MRGYVGYRLLPGGFRFGCRLIFVFYRLSIRYIIAGSANTHPKNVINPTTREAVKARKISMAAITTKALNINGCLVGEKELKKFL